MVNTWRLINPIGSDQPLALCDCSTVEQDDLVLCDRIVVDHLSEMYMLKHNPGHVWYWTDRLTSDELSAFVTWDSKEGDHAKYCPHTSFVNTRTEMETPPRESVETRSIIITKRS
ncbi:hypothetical protein F4825DRAFT_193965 [Nemania diffusa]|nr:hypothetical protein F4825DRAFT_193965 [Nemania diffusa]